jgi:hypothetical protein
LNHACELARPTAAIAALSFLETAAICRIRHVNFVPEIDLKFTTTCFLLTFDGLKSHNPRRICHSLRGRIFLKPKCIVRASLWLAG